MKRRGWISDEEMECAGLGSEEEREVRAKGVEDDSGFEDG